MPPVNAHCAGDALRVFNAVNEREAPYVSAEYVRCATRHMTERDSANPPPDVHHFIYSKEPLHFTLTLTLPPYFNRIQSVFLQRLCRQCRRRQFVDVRRYRSQFFCRLISTFLVAAVLMTALCNVTQRIYHRISVRFSSVHCNAMQSFISTLAPIHFIIIISSLLWSCSPNSW